MVLSIGNFPKVKMFAQRKGCYGSWLRCSAVLTLATRMFVINEKLFLFAIVDRYPFATCAKDIFV